MKMMSKRNYEIQRREYDGWVEFIKWITFGKIDLSENVDEIFKDVIIVDI